MKYEILFLGKTKDSFLAQGIHEYLKRLNHYAHVEIKTVKPVKIQGTRNHIIEKEGDLLLQHLHQGSYLVALDSHGEQYSSTAFHSLINSWEHTKKLVSFVIGGPLGLSPHILEKADMMLSLSKMTFTHDMIRLFLLEQIYRSYTIKAGEKYHK